MKIIVVGGTGTIGQSVVKELSQRHEVIVGGYKDGNVQIDITDNLSIEAMYKSIGNLDAVVATTGNIHFEKLSEMTEKEYCIGLKSKLMGQVNLVLLGMRYLNDGGSFTLTSGILNNDPIIFGSSAAMVNGALDGFTKSASIEMPRDLRINIVSPTIVVESMNKYANYFRGFIPVSTSQVAIAYSKSVEGAQTGQVYKVGYV